MLSSKLFLAGCCGLFSVGVICPLCGLGIGTSVAASATVVSVAAPVAPVSSDTIRVDLAIQGMTCGGCATTARIVLGRTDGVLDAEVSYESATATVLYDEALTSTEEIIARLEEMTGYEAVVADESKNVAAPSDETDG